jgi:hypothetical protein
MKAFNFENIVYPQQIEGLERLDMRNKEEMFAV